MSSTTRILHTTTWDFFATHLPERFSNSPKEVMEAIMADINDLVQEFWRTSRDGDVGASLVAMRRMLEILQTCFEVCIDIISVFVIVVDLVVDKNLQMLTNPSSWNYYFAQSVLIRPKLRILIDGYRKMFDQSFSKSKDLGELLRFLPGVVVQKDMSMQGMADLYKIKPDALERLINSPIEPLRLGQNLSPVSCSKSGPGHYLSVLQARDRSTLYHCGSIELQGPKLPVWLNSKPGYTLDGYLSGFLQDQDRSQLHHCDPMLQHISLCRHFLSLQDGSNGFDLQS